MPSVKIPRKSTATDMTPFVDVAFLILAFFMLATKFKPPSPVQITTPYSVSSDKLKEQDAIMIEFDSSGRVFLHATVLKAEDNTVKRELIKNVNTARNIGLTENEAEEFVKNSVVGVPFSQLKQYLATPLDRRGGFKQPGIPVDSADNQLATWVANAVFAYQGKKMNILIKGDNNSKFPTFKGVIDALRRNEQFKYQLITDPESAPVGTELYYERQKQK